MKKLLFSISSLLLLWSTTSAISLLDNAITWAYTKKLTIYIDSSDFKPDNSIRRDEAAKFFVNFAKLSEITYRDGTLCQFSDLNKAWPDLKDVIVKSCAFGFFKGTNNMFNPTGNLTNAEAIAVLIRIVSGYQSEDGLSHRSDNYYKKANELELLQNINMDNKNSNITRGDLITLLYNARNLPRIHEIPLIEEGDGVINLNDDKERGFIEQIYTDPNGINKIEVDFVQFIACNYSNSCKNFDYKLINENNKLRTFPIPNAVEIIGITGTANDGYSTYTIPFSQLSKQGKLMLFSIKDGNIIRIEPTIQPILIYRDYNGYVEECNIYGGILGCVS